MDKVAAAAPQAGADGVAAEPAAAAAAALNPPTSPQPGETTRREGRGLAIFIRAEVDPAVIAAHLEAIIADHGLQVSSTGVDSTGAVSGAAAPVVVADSVAWKNSKDLRLEWTCGVHKKLGNCVMLTFSGVHVDNKPLRVAKGVGKAALCTGAAVGGLVLGAVALVAGTAAAIVFESGGLLIAGGAGFVGGIEFAGNSMKEARDHVLLATAKPRALPFLYNRGLASDDGYGAPVDRDGEAAPVIFPAHTFEDNGDFVHYFFGNTSTYLSNLQVTRVPDGSVGNVWTASTKGARTLTPAAAAVGDTLDFLGQRVYFIEVPEEAAEAALLRVEVAATTSVNVRVRKGRPPTRFSPNTALARTTGNASFGVSIGPDTRPPLTAGRWYVAVSAVAPAMYSIACQYFHTDDPVLTVAAMCGEAHITRAVSGGGSLETSEGGDADAADEWQMIDVPVVDPEPSDNGGDAGDADGFSELTQGSDIFALSESELRHEIAERSGGPVPPASASVETLAGLLFPLLPPSGIPCHPRPFGSGHPHPHASAEGVADAAAAPAPADTDDDHPEWLMCPISYTLFEDPVFTADGQTYERASIRRWFDDGHSTSPLTNLKLPHTKLVPNFAMRRMVRGYVATLRPHQSAVV